ncbi:hypothetical protein [Ornithinibacillus halotolerans]|uniref:Uncharacterized protein n=1 Tax=Ornithinibacillus halotolerans TaxID=1274357 RepID=A0A916S0M8_9BACI|nr:hypothetical protein [Ornithinibacillus halotolerans]GGA79271.1 hypothetical protein GCM10008025_23360 [Ornithinibacillus halotolerans]
MKLKTVKGKLIAGAVTVGLVSGIGFTFANTDAGGKLSDWYDAAFNNTAASIESQVSEYAEGKIPEIEERMAQNEEYVTENLTVKKNSEARIHKNEINKAKESHLAALESEKQEILDDMGRKFYQEVFLPGLNQIQTAAAEGLEQATTSLTGFTNEKSEEVIGDLTNQLNTARDNAVAELEAAIEEAQAEIRAALESQEESSVYSLTQRVNLAVSDLKQSMNDISKALVQEQFALIEATAEQLTNDAKDALDNVVAGADE